MWEATAPSLCVRDWLCMFVRACVSTIHVCVLSLFLHGHVLCVVFFCGLWPVLLHVLPMWRQHSAWTSALTFSLSHKHTHKCTHTSDPHSSLLHSALKGSILMTVNSPDNRALSIFRQHYSVVKWTNTQRMRLLTGLMMPDWLAAADASGDEDVIYPFLTLSLQFCLSVSLLSLSHTHTPSFIWKLLLCSFAVIDKSMFS